MALINKDNNTIANFGNLALIFETELDFNLWYAELKNPVEDIKKFIIIQNYLEIEPVDIVEIIINNESFGIYRVRQ